jgi:rhamnosyltransferase
MALERARVAAVVVIHYPERQALSTLLGSVEGQVATVFVVDNTPSADASKTPEIISEYGDRIVHVPLGRNTGIATAQNAGIRAAAESGHTHVLLMDDDSVLPPAAIDRMLEAEKTLIGAGQQVAVIAPAFVDRLNGKMSAGIRHRWFREEKITLDAGGLLPVKTDHVQASGSLIRISVLDRIGVMRDDFFLNFVDIEWCVRASRNGYTSFILPNVVMEHAIGDQAVYLFGKEIRLHSLFNDYYFVRNAAYLLRQKSISYRLRSMLLLMLPKYVVVHGWLTKSRWTSYKVLFRALREGLSGTMRQCPVI